MWEGRKWLDSYDENKSENEIKTDENKGINNNKHENDGQEGHENEKGGSVRFCSYHVFSQTSYQQTGHIVQQGSAFAASYDNSDRN